MHEVGGGEDMTKDCHRPRILSRSVAARSVLIDGDGAPEETCIQSSLCLPIDK